MIKQIIRKRRVLRKLKARFHQLYKGRYKIECVGKRNFTVYDLKRGGYIEDMNWGGWEFHSISFRKDESRFYECPSIFEAKQTIDFIVRRDAKSYMNSFIDAYHRRKTDAVLYT